MFDKITLLESVLGKSIPAHRDNVSFHCPFCNHPKPKLNVSLETGAWGCWVCGQEEGSKSRGRSITILFVRLKVDRHRIQQAKMLWDDRSAHTEVTTKKEISLPAEYIPLWQPSSSFFHKRAESYIFDRGLTKLDIVKYRLGYCISGRYANMIVMPSYDASNQLNYFAGRSYLSDPQQKFLVPQDFDKDIICYESTINWSEPVIIVESQMNAMTIRRNAVPLNGKSIPDKLKQRIVEYRVPSVILCLDGDATTTAMRHAYYFLRNGIDVYKVNIPDGEDANSLGYDKIWKLIDNAEKITESNSFEFNILNRLYG